MKRLIKNQIFALVILLSVGMTQVLFAKTNPEKLVQKVECAISNQYIESFDIKADTSGKVILSGDVNSLYDRYKIFDIVAQVPGVVYIENKLNVKTDLLPDKVILANIVNQLEQTPSILEPNRIKVSVTNGFVFLTGDVSYYREKVMAQEVASWQHNVKGIENEINVLPPKKAVSDSNIESIVKEILKNHFVNGKTMTFTVQNGIVTLNGKTSTMWDKSKVEQEISHILGVTKVVNNLKVIPAEW